MAFKMKAHPGGPFEKNYGIKKGGHKKVSKEKFNKLVDQNEEFRNEGAGELVDTMAMTKDKTLIPATEQPKEFDVIKKRETYEYTPQSQRGGLTKRVQPPKKQPTNAGKLGRK
jgi:hypothetical protein